MRMNSTVRGTFCRLLHLLSRGMDWFLQVRTVMWGGGKISSTHPYNAGESETRQLVQSLSEVPGKPRALAVPRPAHEPQGQRTGGNGQHGLLRWPPSDNLITFLTSYAKIQATLHPKCVPPLPGPAERFIYLHSCLGEGQLFCVVYVYC